VLAAALAGVAGGCVGRGEPALPTSSRAIEQVEPWSFDGEAGRVLRTQHFALHTTSDDADLLNATALALEAARTKFAEAIGDDPLAAADEPPRVGYLFDGRREWERFTRSRTGPLAEVYLQIQRGGYTLGDVFVIYDLGDRDDTVSVAVHEAFHQFAARRFASRLPPVIEEGMASRFESVQVRGDVVSFPDPMDDTWKRRAREVLEGGDLIPLRTLLGWHAGTVAGKSPQTVRAFYVQGEALALYLQESGNRSAFRRMLRDFADGRVVRPDGTKYLSDGQLRGAEVAWIVETYFGPLDRLEAGYLSFLKARSR
jgi:hypothetical protein